MIPSPEEPSIGPRLPRRCPSSVKRPCVFARHPKTGWVVYCQTHGRSAAYIDTPLPRTPRGWNWGRK